MLTLINKLHGLGKKRHANLGPLQALIYFVENSRKKL